MEPSSEAAKKRIPVRGKGVKVFFSDRIGPLGGGGFNPRTTKQNKTFFIQIKRGKTWQGEGGGNPDLSGSINKKTLFLCVFPNKKITIFFHQIKFINFFLGGEKFSTCHYTSELGLREAAKNSFF